jgi:hypothetical protein
MSLKFKVTTYNCGTLKREKETLLSFEELINRSFGMTPNVQSKNGLQKILRV